jgi:hypothetical protein
MSKEKCCPDLGFLIVFPSYWAGGIPSTGHAAAAVLNGRTGEFMAYDFGPDDHGHTLDLGYVRQFSNVLSLDKNCLPTCGDLEKVIKTTAKSYGKDFRNDVSSSGDIQGVLYAKLAGSYEKSVAYAADKAKINEEYKKNVAGEEGAGKNTLSKEYHYSALSHNCMTFAVSVIAGKKSGRPMMADWPANDINLYRMFASMLGTGTNFSYNAKTEIFTCDGCCIKTSSHEWKPTPEEIGSIPLGGGLYYNTFPGEF